MVRLQDIYNYTIKRNNALFKKAGINISERNFQLILLITVMAIILFGHYIQLTHKSIIILAIMYVLTILTLPSIIYESKIEKFESNLPKALYVMVLALESGRSIMDAIDDVIESGIKEVDVVFFKIILLMKVNKLSFEEAMLIVSNNTDSKIFRQIGRLIIENRKYGGELAEVLKTLAKTLEDLQNLKSQLLSVTANGLAVGLIIICGVVPATAGIIGGYMNAIAGAVPNATPVTPEQISKCIEAVQMGTGLFGVLFAIPLFGLKVNRMIIISTICMTMGMLSFYALIKGVGLLFS
ncbi:type II secretion system F family protein [Methanothermococcus sp. SCGC AD-155-M21]|nr:type II secretion system F family protein [Methanothermococcus sp. SCGC AD-155-M21]